MSNIFSKTNNFVDKPNRNTFDLSFQNNATFEFGKLYPVLCKEVLPGDSFNIDATFGLKFMPFYWPVQTRMKANLHFFYVRRRNLWKDFVDFWGNTKDGLVPPYLSFSDRTMLETGELADYLGVPTNFYGEFGSTVTISTNWQKPNNATTFFTKYSSPVSAIELFEAPSNTINQPYNISDLKALDYLGISQYTNVDNLGLIDWSDENVEFKIKFYPCNLGDYASSCDIKIWLMHDDTLLAYAFADEVPNEPNYQLDISKLEYRDTSTSSLTTFNAMKDSVNRIAYQLLFNDVSYANLLFAASDNSQSYEYGYTSQSREISEYDSLNPYLPSNSQGKVLISAEPFRAYEAIYNAFYRNAQNNPYILNGVKEYNKFIPTNDGGIDNTSYKLHYRNWEQDFLTTATQTPQQGDFAPLVGITSTGQMTFQDNDGNTYKAYADVNDDGTIKGLKIGETGLPAGTLHALVDSISTGISINDFRNVNSLQRWLEKNLRRGYRFKDQIMSHFGVDVRYDELDMPEFIGGCSQDVNVNQISNTNGDGDVPLGDYAGQASCVGTTRNAVSHYFDEPGYVMAIMSITPVPNYSQLLPKYLIKRNLFDYYFPEFGHIGMQPILMNEVCPVQQYSDDPTKLNNVFGYQRAWYDYLASVDEVHGYFRSELRNFLINRRFDTAPELSESFLLCDPSQINDVFQVTDKTHKILGQIYFDIKAKRPIPEFGIPKLE